MILHRELGVEILYLSNQYALKVLRESRVEILHLSNQVPLNLCKKEPSQCSFPCTMAIDPPLLQPWLNKVGGFWSSTPPLVQPDKGATWTLETRVVLHKFTFEIGNFF